MFPSSEIYGVSDCVIKTFLEAMRLNCCWYSLETFRQLIAVAHLTDFKASSD
jgi:hypothetical protein